MDFALTDDQISIRSAVEEICVDFDDEYWLKKDREGGFPEDFYLAMATAGWLGVAMPQEYGGAGLGISEACLMLETVAGSGACLAGASAIHMNVFGLHPVVVHGTAEQKQRWLPAIIQGRNAGNAPTPHEKIVERIPARRLGQASEVASIVAFLASDEASYVSGSAYTVDGARTAG